MTSMLKAAAQYVEHGYYVFPVGTDKKPLTPHGLKDAAVNAKGVEMYWTKWPDAGIGLVTDGLVVLDFDAAHGGLESKDAIEAKYGALPDTRTHETGGGGFHFLFRNPNGHNIRNTVQLGGYQGVDVRANGGYIVVPPSKHASGHNYKVVDKHDPVPAPDWLIKLCAEQPVTAGPLTPAELITEGVRDATLTSLAGTMRRKGFSQQAIEAALATENQSRCQPPLPDKDIARIAASVSRYLPDPLASLPTEQTDLSDKTDTADIPDIIDSVDIDRHLTDKVLDAGRQVTTDRVVWPMVASWLIAHQGEQFDLDTICRQLDVKTRDHRHSVVKRLAYEVSQGKLEKSVSQRPPLYKYINRTLLRMNWLEASSSRNLVALRWPSGRDGSEFGFAGQVLIPEKGLVVLAGVTNTGKSVFCRNFLFKNMDAYKCFYFSSETSESDFAEYANAMQSWADPLDEKGVPKFELVSRNTDWKDVIQPTAINIIDWLNLGDCFYQLGTVLEGIKGKLTSGMCLIAIQKDPNKELGMGGMWGEHLASLYCTMDYGHLTVKKAKKWHEENPNGKSYGFDIIDHGAHFATIRETRKCKNCGGTGIQKGQTCIACTGTGYMDVIGGK